MFCQWAEPTFCGFLTVHDQSKEPSPRRRGKGEVLVSGVCIVYG